MKKVNGMINEYEKIKRIKASVGRHSGSHYNLEINILSGMVIWSEGLYWESECVIQADTESNIKFIEGMRKCKILNWEQEYNNYHVLDGTQWRLDVEFDDLYIHKSGSNAYPKEWEGFCKAIQILTGKPFT